MKKRLLLCLLLPLFCFSQSVGPNNPAFGQCVPSSACLGCPGAEWNNPGNIQFSDNNIAYAALQLNPNCFQSACFKSRFLYGSNFGFSIPLNATIVGILAEVERSPGNPGIVVDSVVRLYLGTFMIGADYASPVSWPNGFIYASYGGASDLWSYAWTPVDINDPSFGLFFKIYNSSPNVTPTVAVDHIRMTIYYSLATGVFSQTSFPSDFKAGFDQQSGKPWFSFYSIENRYLNASIFDVTGKQVWAKNALNVAVGLSRYEADITSLKPGVYFIQIESANEVKTEKIVVN